MDEISENSNRKIKLEHNKKVQNVYKKLNKWHAIYKISYRKTLCKREWLNIIIFLNAY